MENVRQPDFPIALTNTNATQGPGNGWSEDNTESLGMGTGSNRQDTIVNGSPSMHLSVSSQECSINVDFKLLWRLRKYLVLLAVLAVSVTYNAGLTPPGGFWTLNKDGHDAGDPILHVGFSQRYEVFFYCNATAFAASLVLIILLLSKSVSRQRVWLRSMQLTMILDLFSLLGAYAAGSCRAAKSSIYIWILVFAVFVYVGIHTLVFIRVIPKTWAKKLQTMLNGILSKWGVPERQVSNHLKKDIEEARKFIFLLATFGATITYQAGLNPPGGFWAEDESGSLSKLASYKHRPATSVLRSNYLHRYNIFVSFNATSFVASLVTIILLLSPELSKHGIRTKAVITCVVADLLCLIGAYAAGCCRDVVTSFYVSFMIIIMLFSFALLVGIFIYKPVASWAEKVKSHSLRCMGVLGRALSLNRPSNAEQEDSPASRHQCMGVLGRALSLNRPSNAEQEDSPASRHQSSVHLTDAPAEDSAPEPEDQSAGNQQDTNIKAKKQHSINIEEVVSNSKHPSMNSQQSENINNVVSDLEYQSTDHQLVANMEEEDVSNPQHPSGNCQQSVNTKVVLSNLEYGSTDCQVFANMEEVRFSTEQEYPSVSYQQTENANCGMSTDTQQVASSMREHSSTDDTKIIVLPVEQNMSVGHSSGATGHDIVDEGLSVPTEASGNVDCAEQDTLVEDDNRDTEIAGSTNCTERCRNVYIDSKTEKHLKQTRSYLLLLAILAVSLAYQSGLNPPGGFWSRTEDHHLAGDRILEDTHHPRFIAFFYLNAIVFVASIVMIIMLLDKMMSKKVTKRRALPVTMIAVLLSLTGAFAVGSSREAKKTIFISVLVCVVLAYVAVHVLITIHIIPQGWKSKVAKNLKRLPVRHLWPVSCQSGHDSTADATSEKELERRCNILLTLAILAVTVTYQAGMNPPGGVWSDDKNVTGLQGNPILQDTHPKRYDVFYYSNSVSFVSSVVVTILLVNKESCEHGIKSYALRVCMVVGLLGLLIAYVAGSCRNHKQSIYLSIIAVAVLVSLMIQVLLSSMHDTRGKLLDQCVGFVLSCLFGTEKDGRETTSEMPEASDCSEKIVRKKHKYLMLLAILAASIAYQAGLNPPGGFWPDDKDHVAGNPILHDINHQRYKIFFCFNSFAFMASIVVIMLLLSKSVREKGVPLVVLHLIMILDLLALMTAFAVGSCRKFRTSVYVYALVIGVVIYLVIVIVFSNGIAKCLRTREKRRLPKRPSRTSMSVPGNNFEGSV